MRTMRSASSSPRIAFHCDGNERVGAGHVARCLPLSAAFAELGWTVGFVGEYGGLAAWLLERAGIAVSAGDPRAPCGVGAEDWEAAVIDSYVVGSATICELAGALPLVTLGEANRCASRGIVLDYHLDAAAESSARMLAGPSFAPIDPAFAGAGRAGEEIRTVLVTVGGSLLARELLQELVPVALSTFAEAEIRVAGGLPAGEKQLSPRVVGLPSPMALVDVVGEIDLTVTAAGFTSYEMACAGIPQLAIAIVANQSRVVRALLDSALAPCLDLPGGDSLGDLAQALEQLRDPQLRSQLSERGMRTFDGNGARRAAAALVERFGA